MWAQYLGLWIFFIALFVLVMVAYYYSKWHIKGPIWKLRARKMKAKLTGKGKKSVKVKKGEAVTSSAAAAALKEAREGASHAQDHLNVQNLETVKEQEEKEAVQAWKAKKEAPKKNIFKKNKKSENDEDSEINSSESILDKISDGPVTAQDLLHEQEDEKTTEVVEEATSIFEETEKN